MDSYHELLKGAESTYALCHEQTMVNVANYILSFIDKHNSSIEYVAKHLNMTTRDFLHALNDNNNITLSQIAQIFALFECYIDIQSKNIRNK